ncbi:MAG: metallophosphoesterase [Ilumatobacteraceae bacterium]
MPRTVVAQISDPHITGANDPLFEGSDPVSNLIAAITHAAARAEVVVITGDLAARAGTDAEYEGVRAVLDAAAVEVLLCAGNHDESRKIQEQFDHVGVDGRLDYVRTLSQGQLVVLDSSRAGREDGVFDDDQAKWLEERLAGGEPTLVAMHHPCFSIGGAALAGVRLDDESVERLARVVSRHGNVLSVVSGHAHMTLSAPFAGSIAHACPSVAYEFDFRGRDLIYRPGHPRYMLYTWISGGRGFFAREITVAPDTDWLVMESF